MPECKTCKKEKPETAYAVENGYRRLVCRACRAEYKRWRKANGLERESYDRKRAAAVELVDGVKRGPCVDCGRTFPTVAMDFDHVRGTKTKSIGLMVGDGSSLEAIQAEIAKCDLVCACCHRIRTATRAGWRGAA